MMVNWTSISFLVLLFFSSGKTLWFIVCIEFSLKHKNFLQCFNCKFFLIVIVLAIECYKVSSICRSVAPCLENIGYRPGSYSATIAEKHVYLLRTKTCAIFVLTILIYTQSMWKQLVPLHVNVQTCS